MASDLGGFGLSTEIKEHLQIILFKCLLQHAVGHKPTVKRYMYCWFVCLKVVHILNISFIRDGMLFKSLERENFDNILANPNESDFSIFISIAYTFTF